MQWLGVNSTACGGVNTDRYLNKGLMGNVQWNINRGDVICSGNEKPHKRLRTFSHKTGYTNVLENFQAQSHSSLGGQHVTFNISVKDEGDTQSLKLVQLAKEIWNRLLQCGITLTTEYLSQQTERDSRLGVKKQF